ncbi:ArsR/SmtB family transcription factor [Notoacmeibacter marinus]|uniref:ArsR/SmtB family transcription factor n=1 Tax=Notoacmeibacter marinus TaxID=1876515 RepID=UPI000DF368AD|nr:helix-turn-helix domain-containing protein [Notoacmeibacter marinus]
MNNAIRALSSDKRRQVLEWLRNPEAHFPPQRDGDLVADGVCVVFIADKLGVSQPTATEHMKVLHKAGLVIPTRNKTWTFYRRDEDGIARARDAVLGALS